MKIKTNKNPCGSPYYWYRGFSFWFHSCFETNVGTALKTIQLTSACHSHALSRMFVPVYQIFFLTETSHHQAATTNHLSSNQTSYARCHQIRVLNSAAILRPSTILAHYQIIPTVAFAVTIMSNRSVVQIIDAHKMDLILIMALCLLTTLDLRGLLFFRQEYMHLFCPL